MEERLKNIESKQDRLLEKFTTFKDEIKKDFYEFQIETVKKVSILQVKTGLFWGIFVGIVVFFARDLLK